MTWAGADGYYRYATESISYLFDATLADIRTFTRKPILVAEPGVAPVAGQAAKLLGPVRGRESGWPARPHLVRRQGNRDWRTDTDPAARAAFGASVRRYGYQGAASGA